MKYFFIELKYNSIHFYFNDFPSNNQQFTQTVKQMYYKQQNYHSKIFFNL